MNAIITAMTTVFSAIFTWIQAAINSIIPIFYAQETGGAGSFTFLGVMLLVSLGISIFFLLLGVISNFIHLRG